MLAFERTHEGDERVVVVVNAGRGSWQLSEYGVYVGGGRYEEVFHSAAAEYGGWEGLKRNPGQLTAGADGKLFLNISGQSTIIFKQVE